MNNFYLLTGLLFLISYAASAPPQRGCPNMMCPAIYSPVCGTDGKTYSSECAMGCTGARVAYRGECRETTRPSAGCICTMEYNPVCGSDGNTYGNPCGARCAGVSIVSYGPCPSSG